MAAYFEAWDPKQRISVWLITGRMSPAEKQRNLDAMKELDAAGCIASVLIADSDAAAPDAEWRRAISETVSGLRARKAFALVTKSVVVRGALTALNWFRQFDVPTRAFSTVDEAADFVGRYTGVRPDLTEMVADVRAQERRARAAAADTRRP